MAVIATQPTSNTEQGFFPRHHPTLVNDDNEISRLAGYAPDTFTPWSMTARYTLRVPWLSENKRRLRESWRQKKRKTASSEAFFTARIPWKSSVVFFFSFVFSRWSFRWKDELMMWKDAMILFLVVCVFCSKSFSTSSESSFLESFILTWFLKMKLKLDSSTFRFHLRSKKIRFLQKVILTPQIVNDQFFPYFSDHCFSVNFGIQDALMILKEFTIKFCFFDVSRKIVTHPDRLSCVLFGSRRIPSLLRYLRAQQDLAIKDVWEWQSASDEA